MLAPKETNIPKPELSHTAERIIAQCITYHDVFDREIWSHVCSKSFSEQGDNYRFFPSFHNSEHIRSVIKASDKLVEEALTYHEDRYFNLKKDLQKYNDSHNLTGVNPITNDEMKSCMRMAFAGHDIGDVCHLNGDKITFFKDGYHGGQGSEVRSADIIKKMLGEAGIEIRLVNFVDYLIRETTYIFPQDGKAFAKFMRFVDFVGNGYFNKDIDRFLGLFLEQYNLKIIQGVKDEEIENWEVDLDKEWFNMVPEVFAKYFPKIKERNRIAHIWKENWAHIGEHRGMIISSKEKIVPWMKELLERTIKLG